MKIERVSLILVFTALAAIRADQITIGEIEQMPNLPNPYEMRDWKTVAVDFDNLVFDVNRTGEYLPMIWFDPRKHDFNEATFALPAYVGHYAKAQNAFDTITCLHAVSGATLVGIDKSNQQGYNWVAMCQNYFSKSNGQNLYLNNVPGTTGATFWYEVLPNILFYRIHYFYPGIGEMDRHFVTVADRWYEACVGMGGKSEPYAIPDFNYTAYNFSTGKPIDNKVWKEADASGAIAWLECMAWAKTKEPKYLTAARWGLDWLQNCKRNPYYEALMPHGVYAAARINAETGSNYDVQRFLNWCFDGTNWRHFGTSRGKWGGYDCWGLVGSRGEEYGFAMNTFDMAGNLVPIARYDSRFARAIGKWMLNAANSARLLYPYALDEKHQTDYAWSKKYDPTSCIAYEGIQDCQKAWDRAVAETTTSGKIISGTIKDTIFHDGKCEVLEGTRQQGKTHIEHTWTIPLTSRTKQVIVMRGHCENGTSGYEFSYKIENGNFQKVFTLNSDKETTLWNELPSSGGNCYLKLKYSGDANSQAKVSVDDLYVRGRAQASPFANGDPRDMGWGATNLGLYGSAAVGIFGAIIEKTNVECILELDCLATDYYHQKAYPTHLYYNPYATEKTVTVDVGKEAKDIYDTATKKFVKKSARGKTGITIMPDSAVVLVITPANGKVTYKKSTMYVDGTAVDFYAR